MRILIVLNIILWSAIGIAWAVDNGTEQPDAAQDAACDVAKPDIVQTVGDEKILSRTTL